MPACDNPEHPGGCSGGKPSCAPQDLSPLTETEMSALLAGSGNGSLGEYLLRAFTEIRTARRLSGLVGVDGNWRELARAMLPVQYQNDPILVEWATRFAAYVATLSRRAQ